MSENVPERQHMIFIEGATPYIIADLVLEAIARAESTGEVTWIATAVGKPPAAAIVAAERVCPDWTQHG